MDHPIEIHLIRSRKRRKTFSLEVKEDGRVFLSVPFRTSRREAERFIRERQSWIIRKTLERERTLRETEKAFVSGEHFFYLGASYPLELLDSERRTSPLELSSGHFILGRDHIGQAKELFVEWYKRKAIETIVPRVKNYSHRFGLFPKSIRITNAKSRWGSCSAENRLSFSWHIILAPLEVIDYILLHELAHIQEKNHSKRFWNFLESILPDYKNRRQWLKRNGYRLRF